jgi:hypothetical protein
MKNFIVTPCLLVGIFLVASQSLFAQKLLDPSGFISVVGSSSGGSNATIAVAYSVRQLKTTYDHAAITSPVTVSGFTNSSTPLLRVKRSFDNALLDIGYDGNGNLDTVLLKNFVTGKVGVASATNPTANGLVIIWYDQSGNSRDAIEDALLAGGAPIFPYIVTAGVIERNGGGQLGIAGVNGGMLSDGGDPFDNGTGFNRYGISGDRTLNVVSQPRAWSTVGLNSDGSGTYLIDRNGAITNNGKQDPPLTCIKAVGNYWAAQIRNDSAVGADITQSFAGTIPISVNRSDNVTIVRTGNNYPMYVNGVLAGTATLAGTNSMSPVRIGYGTSTAENVYYGEFILFPSALSTLNLTALNTSQSNYFTLGSAPGTWTGFTSSDLTVASNWSNNAVPDALSDITIPTGAPNAPIVTGGQTNLVVKKLTIATGATLTINGNLSVSGDVVVNGTVNGSGTLTMSGSLSQSLGGTPVATVSNLVIANTVDTVSIISDLDLSGTLTVNANAELYVLPTKIINSGGNAGTLTGSGTVLATRVASTSDFQSQYKFNTYTLSNLTVNYMGAGAQTINLLTVNYGNLMVSGSGIKVLSGAITATNVTGNITVNAATLYTNNFNIGSPTNRTITIASGAILNAGTSVITFGSGTKQLTINGTFQTENLNGFSLGALTAIASTNTPTITPSVTSTVEYTALATQIVTPTSYGGLELTNGSKTISAGTLTLTGNVIINSGAAYNGAANPVLNIAGNFINNGTFTSGMGDITFGGTGAQAISSVTTPLAFGGNVIFSGASSTTMGVNASIVGTLTVNTGKTLDLGTYTFNRTVAAGTMVVAGTLKLGGNTGGQTGSNFPLNFSTLTFTAGTIEYNGSNAITQTVYSTTAYNNLTLTNGSGTGNAAKVSAGNFSIATGRIMTVNAGTTFTPATGNVITAAGALTTLTGFGTIDVTGGAAIATQYNFAVRTLTNLTVNYNGGGTIPAGTYSSLTTSGSGTTTLGGAVIITGSVTIGSGTTLAAGTNTLSVAGDWINNGAFTTGATTVTFNGTTTQTIGGSVSTGFSTLSITNATGAVVVSTNTNVSVALTLGTGATLTPDAGVVFNNAVAAGTISATGAATINVTRILSAPDYQSQYKFNTNTLTNITTNYSGAGNQTINLGVNYSSLIISGSGIKTFSAAVTATNVTGNITVNAATLATTGNMTLPTNCTVTVAVGATLNAGTSVIAFNTGTKVLNVNGTFQTANTNGFTGSTTTAIHSTNAPTITLGTSSTIEYSASGAGQIVTIGTAYNNLVLSTASKTIAAGTLTVSGSLTIGSGATFLGTTNNPALTVSGNFTNSGTYTSGTGLVTFNGTAAQAILSGTTPLAFGGSVIFSGASSTATMGVNATVVGTLTVSTTKTLDLSTYTFNRTAASGTLVVAGTLKLGGSTGGQTGSNFPTNFSTYTFTGGVVEYNGSDAITQTVFNGPSYAGLTLTNGSGSGNALKISTGNFTVTGTMTINALVQFTPTTGNIITGTGGTLTGSGNIDVVGAALAIQYAFTTKVLTNLTVNYVGGGGTIPAGTYSSLTTSGTGTTTLGGGVIVTGNVTIGSGTTLAAGTNTLQVAGNWTNNGTYTTGTALVTFNGTSGQTIGGSAPTSFSSLTIANKSAAVNVTTNTNVSGTLTISDTALLVPDAAVVFNNSAAAGTLTGTGTIKVTRIAITADLVNQYKFTSYTLTNLTVEYAGAGSQTINSTATLVTNYGALTVSGSGTKTLQGNITVTNDVTLTSSTFATAGFNITTTGSWVNNGVPFGGTGTVNLNGANKTISGTTATAFPALVLGTGASYTMNNSNTCTGLTLTASATASSFTHGTNNILTVNGNVTINQPTAVFTTAWNINAAAVTVTGTFNLGGANTTASRVASVVITTGALTINGASTITGSATAANTLINMSGGAGTLNFGGAVTLTSASTLNAGTTSTVNYNGTAAQTIPFSATFIYNNLSSANSHASGATFGAAVTAANLLGNISVLSGILNTNSVAVAMAASKTITVANGAIFNTGTTSLKPGTGATVTINGTLTTANLTGFSGAAGAAVSSSNTPTITLGSNSTIEHNASSGTQAVTVGYAYSNLTLSNAGGTQTASGNVIVNGALTTIGTAVFTLGTNTLTGTLTSVSHSGRINTSNTSATPIPADKIWGGIVMYNALTGGQTVMAGTYNTLSMGNATSGTQTASGNITLTTLNNNANANNIFNMGAFILSATTITNTATIRTQNTSSTPITNGLTIGGTVTYDATTAGQTIVEGTYTTLTMSNTSGTQTAGGNITATTLNNNVAGITLDLSTYALVATTITNNATATIRTQNISGAPLPTGKTWGGTVTYDAATGEQTVMAGTYANLTISNTSGTDTASGNISSTGTFTNTVGGLLDMKTYSLTVTTVANAGTITTSNTSATPITTGKTWGGEVIYAGSGSQTIVAGNYNDLTSTSTGARTLINGGTIAVAGAFSHGTNAYTVTGNTFTYNATGAQTIASFDYNNLTISGARGSQVVNLEAGTIGIAGAFTISATGVGSYDVSGNTINYSGVAQTVLTTFEYNNLTYSGSGAKTGAATINATFSLEGTATAGSVLVYGTSATLQYNKGANYTATINEWPASFTSEGGVVIKNVGVISITAAKAVSFSLNINTNAKLNLSTLTTHTANGLILGGIIRSATGTWGSTSSTATNKNDSFFSATVGRITLSSLTSTWTGITSTDWSATANWTPNTIPTSTRDAVIPTGAIRQPTMTAIANCRSLTIAPGATVTSADFTINIYGDYTNTGGTFTLGSSPVNITGTTNQTFDAFTTTGVITVSNATGDVSFNGITGASDLRLTTTGSNVIVSSTLTLSDSLTLSNLAAANIAVAISGAGTINCVTLGVGNGTAATTNSTTRTHILTSTLANLIVSGNLVVNSYFGATARYSNGSFIHTSGLVLVGGTLTTLTANGTNVTSYIMGNSSPQLNLSGAAPFAISTTGTNTITLNGTGAIVNYKGTSAQAIRATPYIFLKVNNTAGVSLNANATMTNLTIGDETSNAIFNDAGFTITPNASSELNLVSGTYNLGTATATIWPAWATNNINGGTTVAYNSSAAQTVSTTPVYNHLILTGAGTKTIAAGTLKVDSNWNTTATLTTLVTNNSSANIEGNVTGIGAITSGSGTIAVAGNWSNSGTFTAGTGTVNYDGTGPQSVAALTYNNLTLSNTRTGSPAIILGSGTVKIGGVFTLSATGIGSYIVTGNTIEYSGTGAQTIIPFNYNNLTLSGPRGGATVTLGSGNIGVAGAFSNTATTIGGYTTTGNTFTYSTTTGGQNIAPFIYNNLVLSNTSGNNTASGNIVVDGTLTTSTGGTLLLSTYTLSGFLSTITNNAIITSFNTSLVPFASGRIWGGAGIVTYAATTGAQTVMEGTYNNITLSNGSGTNSASGNITINGTLTTTSGGFFDMSTFVLTGTLTTSGTGTIQTQNTSATPIPAGKTWSNTIEYNSSSAQAIVYGKYANLTGTGGNRTLSATDTVAVSGIFTTGAGVYTATSSTVNYSSLTGGQILAGITYNNLVNSNTSGTNTVSGDLTVNGVLTLNPGATLDLGTSLLGGTLTTGGTGTIQTQNTTSTPIPVAKTWSFTVMYNGSSPQTMVYGKYTMLNGTGGNRTLSATDTVAVSGTFTGGAGTYTSTSSIVNYNGTGAQTLAAITYNNLLLSGARTGSPAITLPSGTIGVGGSFILTATGIGSYVVTGNTVNYTATGGSQTVAGITYNNLTLSNTSGTNTVGSALTVNGVLTTTTGGTLDLASNQLSGTFTTSGAGTINTQNTSATPIPVGKTWSNTIVYNSASAQTIVYGKYSNLTGTGGNRTLSATDTVAVSGTFTQGAGTYTTTSSIVNYNGTGVQTLAAITYNTLLLSGVRTGSPAITLPSGTIGIAGNFILSATGVGSYVTTGNTVNYTATAGSQTVAGITYNNLTLSNTSATNTAGSALTVNGVLTTSTGGTLNMGTNQLLGTFTTSGAGTIQTQDVSTTPIPVGKTWSNTVVYNSASPQTIVYGKYSSLNGTGANRTLSSTDTVAISGTFTPGAGTYTVTSSTVNYNGTGAQTFAAMSYNNLVLSGARTGTPAITLPSGTINIAGNFTLSATGVGSYIVTGNTVNYTATGGSQVVAGITYNNLTLSNTSGTNTVGNNLTVNGILTTTTGGTLDLATNQLLGTFTTSGAGTINTQCTTNPAIPVAKTWSNTVAYNSSSAQTIVYGKYSSLNGTGGNRTLSTTDTVAVSGTFTGGVGAYTVTSSTVNYSSLTGGQTVAGITYNNLIVSNTSGTQTAAGTTLTVNGVLTTTAGGTLDLGTATTLAGTLSTITNSGTIKTSVPTATSAVPIPTGKTWNGTVNYGATAGAQTVVAGTYTNLTLSNTSASNAAGGNLSVSGILTTTAGGTLDMGTTALLSGTLTTITNNGTIRTSVPTATSAVPIPTGKTWNGTIIYGATAGAQTVVSGTYTNLTLSNTSASNAAGGNLSVSGTLTTTSGGTLDMGTTALLSGTLTTITNNGTIRTLVPTATSAVSIPTGKTWNGTIIYGATAGAQTVVAGTYTNLTLSNTSASNAAGGNLSVGGTLTTTSGGTLDMGTTALLSGTLTTITNGGTIKTSVPTITSATPLATGKTWTGLVDYGASSAQTIVAGTYNNVSMQNTSADNVLGGNVTVGGTLTLKTSGRKLTLGSNTLTVNGAISNMSASVCFIANGSSNISIGGSGSLGTNLYLDQTTPGTTNRLNNITYNRASQTITLGDSVEVVGTITPTAGTLATGNKLKLVSNVSGTARIAAGSGSYMTGKVVAERYVPAVDRRWRFVSSPVSGTTLQDLKNEIFITGKDGATAGFDVTISNQAGVYTYNEKVATGDINTGWNQASGITDTIKVGDGVRIYIRGDRSDPGRLDGSVTTQNAVTMNLIGPVNMGNITIPVSFTSSGVPANDGWCFIGNPYASNFNWKAFYDAQSGSANCFHIDPTIYIFSPNGNNWVSYNALSDVGTLQDGIIPAGAGFMVKANATLPTLVLSETYKTATAAVNVFKTNEDDGFTIRLEADAISYDELVIKFKEGSTANMDAYDIPKLAATLVNISAYGMDNKELASSVRPLTLANDTIHLKVTATTTGNYTLRFNNKTWTGQKVSLIDSYLKTITDLNAASEYPFTINTAKAESQGLKRFYIIFGEADLPTGVDNIAANENQLYVYPNTTRGLTTVYSSIAMDENVTLNITDLNGRVISTLSDPIWSESKLQLDLSSYASGMYFINFIQNNKTTKTLKCIKE